MPKAKRLRTALPKDATAGQREAFAQLVSFCTGAESGPASQILSGYAGTGKTWLITHLVRACRVRRLRIAVCAPTHKAVCVIAAKLKEDGTAPTWIGTLHALLGLKLKEGPEGTMQVDLDRNPRGTYFEDYDVVVIDEASMVGLSLLSFIERFSRGGHPRILYVGDPGQLRPVESEAAADPDELAGLGDEGEGSRREPPIFGLVRTRHHLPEIVRQKSTGRVHPIVQFAQEVRRYIEGEIDEVFHPVAIQAYVTAHSELLGGGVRLARAAEIGAGAVSLRARRPHKDIRVVAWRNRVVDTHNRFIHRGLSSLHAIDATTEALAAPFWPGEILVAREALFGFRPIAHIVECDAKVWEQALAAHAGADGDQGGRRGTLTNLVANNTELVVEACVPMPHPYLGIASWQIVARMPDGESVEFFVADDARDHQELTRRTWDDYRAARRRTAQDFQRAWAVTRACAPAMHAYAMTAHKAQGSTFHYALVDVADLYGMVKVSGAEDYHRALYVAVTRASERVWLCT
ncbi:MAG TPA: AAA family ATPase [Acidiferrobacter sp.]|nr:AAA family ATPase [Acidiferrobacter sp.]